INKRNKKYLLIASIGIFNVILLSLVIISSVKSSQKGKSTKKKVEQKNSNLHNQLSDLKKQSQNTTDPSKKRELEKKIKDLEKQIEDSPTPIDTQEITNQTNIASAQQVAKQQILNLLQKNSAVQVPDLDSQI